MRQRHIPVLFEQRIGGKVRNHDAFAAVGGGPAGAGLGADRHAMDGGGKTRGQFRGGAQPQRGAILIG